MNDRLEVIEKEWRMLGIEDKQRILQTFAMAETKPYTPEVAKGLWNHGVHRLAKFLLR